MATAHFCPGLRITTSGVDCGKSLPSVSRAPRSSSTNIDGGSSLFEPSSDKLSGATSLSGRNQNTRIQLLGLPVELIEYILSFLDQQAQSLSEHAARPSLNLTQSVTHPLKCLSLTCKTFRSLTIPRLFRFTRLDPASLTDFLRFIHDNDLVSRVESVVAIFDDSENHLTHPLWWARLLKTLHNVIWFSVLAPPLVLGSLFNVPVPQAELWAFNMPYHLLRLHRHMPSTPLDSSLRLYAVDSSPFASCDWDGLVINEGSSLKAYSLYEYFLRKTPSLLASLTSDPRPSEKTSVTAGAMFSRLQSFTYIAIFPFYNHVDNVLKHVRHMTSLKTFITQLSTRADVDAISDEHVDETKKVDMNDCWMELITAYDLILHTVFYLAKEGQLHRWEAKDGSSISAINDELIPKVQGKLGNDWTMAGDGIWTRASGDMKSVVETPSGGTSS